jgi:hypothetical protein
VIRKIAAVVFLGTVNEKIRPLRPEDLVDDRIVKKLEKDGRF